MKRRTALILLSGALPLLLASVRLSALSSLTPWISEANIKNIADKGRWWLDKDGKFSLDDVWALRESELTPLADLIQRTPMYAVVWAAFRYEDFPYVPENPILVSSSFSETIQLFHLRPGYIDSVNCGSFTARSILPIKENFLAAPLKVRPQPGDVIVLRFHNPSGAILGIREVFLVNPGQELLLRHALQIFKMDHIYFFVIFFSALVLLLTLVLLTWSVYRSPSIPLFGIYFAIYLVYYFRHFENEQIQARPLFSILGDGQLFFEVFLGLASVACLLIYLETLLNLKTLNPALSRSVKLSNLAIWCIMPVVMVFGWWGGLDILGKSYLLVKTGMMALVLMISLVLFFQHKDYPPARFAAAGALIMVIGQLMTLSGELFGGPLVKEIAGGAFGYYLLSNGHEIPVFDTKFGLLLEASFFSVAFMFNQKLEKEHLKSQKNLAISQIPPNVSNSEAKDPETPFYPFPITSEFIQSVVERVEISLGDENFGVQELAASVKISRRLLFQKIQDETGLSPSAFIRAIRLRHARQMLEQTDITISEIAFAVGFKYAYYFSKVFKEEFGVNPSDWPRQKKPRNTQ